MSEKVYAVKAEYNEYDDEPCGIYSIYKTREGAQRAIEELLAEGLADIEDADDNDEPERGYEIETYELKE